MTHFLSATSAALWRTCERLFWHTQVRDGGGITREAGEPEDLRFGGAVHEVLPALWGGDSSGIAPARAALELGFLTDEGWLPQLSDLERAAKASEWGRLLEAGLWVLHLVEGGLPWWRSRYTAVAAEADAAYWLDAAQTQAILAKPDLLLEPRDGVADTYSGLGYLEFKTAKEFSAAWRAKWNKNPQLWTGALALQQALGLTLEWFVVLGIRKGQEVADAASPTGLRRASPLAWCYRCVGPTKVDQKVAFGTNEEGDLTCWWRAEYTAGKGWERVSTDSFPGGCAAWAAFMVEHFPNVATEQITVTEPIEVEWDLVEMWLEQQKAGPFEAMARWGDGPKAWDYPDANNPQQVEMLMRHLFPQRFDQCESGTFGRKCAAYELCYNAAVAAAPLQRGWRRRRPHHPIEKAVREGEQQ